jgi:aminodeoxyfutalosine synthase
VIARAPRVVPPALPIARIADPAVRAVAEKVAQGIRLDQADGIALFGSRDLTGVGLLADAVNRARHGDRVTFAANQHINPTNICTLRTTCVFCGYARLPKEQGAYRYTLDR